MAATVGRAPARVLLRAVLLLRHPSHVICRCSTKVQRFEGAAHIALSGFGCLTESGSRMRACPRPSTHAAGRLRSYDCAERGQRP